MSIRPILERRAAQPTMEGAGVHLHRAFGFQDPTELDPFLLFDDFRNDDPPISRKGSRGIRIGGSRRSPMFWKARSNIPTALETAVGLGPVRSNG